MQTTKSATASKEEKPKIISQKSIPQEKVIKPNTIQEKQVRTRL
jgi:hypothetical protein